jgi:hypothetical protein
MDVGTHYEVVVLVERALDVVDARNLRALHEGVAEPVRYHVLLPVRDAAYGVEGAMGALAAGEVFAASAVSVPSGLGDDTGRVLLDDCRQRVAASVRALESVGGRATGEPVCQEPVHALAGKISELDAREVVIVTRRHLVQEFFHVDWTSRAERKLQVPVLHLLEHGGPEDRSDDDGAVV